MKQSKYLKYFVDVKDFPKKGIIFKDWTPLMNNAKAYQSLINNLYKKIKNLKIDVIVSAESRGFWLGCPLAIKKCVRFIPARKPGKLPRPTISSSYDLEYGKNTIEISKGDIKPNDKVLVIDDVIATGGTIEAIIDLVKRSKGKLVGCMFISTIPGCDGYKKLSKKTKIILAD